MLNLYNIVNNVVINIDRRMECIFMTADKNIFELLDYAKKEALHIHKSENFLLKDLFKGYEWNRIPHKDRLLLGTLFLKYVTDNPGCIVASRKTSSKQQVYRKVKLNGLLNNHLNQ